MSAAPAGREVTEVSELPDAPRPNHQITAASAQEEEAPQHQRAVQREHHTSVSEQTDGDARDTSAAQKYAHCKCVKYKKLRLYIFIQNVLSQ